MNQKTIIFEQLILQGFGPYRDTTTFTFKQGINIYAGANESGKTSMAAGLLATIYGLTHRQRSISAFNLERFRNWENPAACRGEFIFSDCENRYQIKRDFDNHQVSLWQLGGGQDSRQLIVEGQHNPEARKPLIIYEEALQNIMGISSRAVFEDTFFVTQPMPEAGQINSDIQGLLVGGKGKTFQGALEKLLSELKNLTRFTGPNDRRLTARNMTKDGDLEIIEERIRKLREEIESGSQAADSLIEVQKVLGKSEQELLQASKDLEQKNLTKQAWSEWQLLASQYTDSSKERDRLKTAVNEVGRLDSEIQMLKGEIREKYPEFKDAGPEVKDWLEKQLRLNSELDKATRLIGEIQADQRLGSENLKRVSSFINEYREWDSLGSDPADKIRVIRRDIGSCLRIWENFKADRKKLADLNRRISDDYEIFTRAADFEIYNIANIHQIRTSLAADAQEALQAYQAAAQKNEQWEEIQREHRSRFGDLLDLPEKASAAAVGKWNLLAQKRDLEKQRSWLRISIAIGTATGALLSGVVWWWLGTSKPAELGAAIILAVFIGAGVSWLLMRRAPSPGGQNYKTISNRLQEIMAQTADLDRQLGPFSQANDMELASLVERIRIYEDEVRRLEAMSLELAAMNLPAAKSRLKEAGEAEAAFQLEMKKFTDIYADVLSAYNEWRDLARERDRLEADLNLFAKDNFGCLPDLAEETDPCSVADESWRTLAVSLTPLLERDRRPMVDQVGSLMDLAAILTDTWWKEREAQAVSLVKMRKEQAGLTYQLDMTSKRLRLENEKIQQLNNKRQGDEICRSILRVNGDDPEQALQRYRLRDQLIVLQNDNATRLETMLKNYQCESPDQLVSKYQRSEDMVASRMLRWQEHLEKYPGLPDPDNADDPGLIQGKIQEIDAAILAAGAEVRRIEGLRSELYKRMARLEGINPINIAAAELELNELREAQSRMKEQADALTLAYRELGTAIAEFGRNYQQRLETKATEYFQEISMVDRRIVLDDQLNIGVMENGRLIMLESLSKGARDQMYLSLRFAIADLLAEDVHLPMIFDDPFTNTDAARIERVRNILDKRSPERQFFILAHAEHYTDWGDPVAIR